MTTCCHSPPNSSNKEAPSLLDKVENLAVEVHTIKNLLKDLAYQQPEVLPHPSQDLPGAHSGHGVHSQVPSNDAISKTNSCEEISVVAEVHDIPNDVSISSIEGFIPEVSIDLNNQALTSQQM